MREDSKAKIMKFLDKVAADVTPVSNARIAAAIVLKGEIISIGINQKKSHPFQQKFLKNEHAIFLHAEIDAIKNALKRLSVDELAKCSLFICRTKWEDATSKFVRGLAHPCTGCMRAISTFNIKEVFYTTDGEDINKM